MAQTKEGHAQQWAVRLWMMMIMIRMQASELASLVQPGTNSAGIVFVNK